MWLYLLRPLIYLITHEDNAWTWNDFLESFGRELVGRVWPVCPNDLIGARQLPVGTYLFTDHEVMTIAQRDVLAQVWDQLERDGRSRLLNHPRRVVGRYELLKLLHAKEINNFRAFHLDELPSDLRFPVFLRVENDHRGSRSPLLNDWQELDAWLVRGVLGCPPGANLIVIEFCDTVCPDGYYRKYGSFIVGGRVLPPMLDINEHWVVKRSEQVIPPTAQEEWDYLLTSPFEKEISGIFEMAGCDFGRIDFAFEDGQMRVWEINSNARLCMPPSEYAPEFLPTTTILKCMIAEALLALDTPQRRGVVDISLHYTLTSARPLDGRLPV